jgi:hypothetical protein
MEIWNFCYRFKNFLEIPKFTIEELHEAFEATEESKGFLLGVLVQTFIQSYIRDIKEFNEREIYSTPAILVLELVNDLPKFPLEAIFLIFGIERYRKYIPESTLSLLNDCLLKSDLMTIYELGYKEKKDLVLSVMRGLFVTERLKELINMPMQHHKQLQKQRINLQKEIYIIQGTQFVSPEENEVLSKKEKEITKISTELMKESEGSTRNLGKDAEDREYWIFAGDKNRIYVKISEEKWRTYSTTKQFNDLLQSFIVRGVEERRLKVMLESVFNDIVPLDLSVVKKYFLRYINRKEQELSYQEKMERKKKVIINFQNNAMNLAKVQTNLLSMEGSYWNFFTERKVYWCNNKKHKDWVNVLLTIRDMKEYGIVTLNQQRSGEKSLY